ncbi:proteoglycan 4-like, partial [Seriola lalandi dorsalis]
QSCLGRCGEPFRRGQLCECDPQCIHHNTCCPDYQLHCDAGVSASHPDALLPLRAAAAAAAPAAPAGNQKSKSKKKANSESEEKLTAAPVVSKSRPSTLQDVASVVDAGSEGPGAGSRRGVGLLPLSIPGSPHAPAPADTLPSYGAPSQGAGAPVSPYGRGAVGVGVNGQLVLSPEGGTPYGSSQ